MRNLIYKKYCSTIVSDNAIVFWKETGASRHTFYSSEYFFVYRPICVWTYITLYTVYKNSIH